jgi:hypothetical protein
MSDSEVYYVWYCIVCVFNALFFKAYIYYMFTHTPQEFVRPLIDEYCINGLLENIKQVFDNNMPKNLDHLFNLACCHGHLHIAKYLLSINSDIKLTEGFCYASRFYYLDICEWLIQIHSAKIDIDDAFLAICGYGQLDMAQLLYSLYPDIITDTLIKGFISSCSPTCHRPLTSQDNTDKNNIHYADCLSVTKWLFSMDRVSQSIDDKIFAWVFEKACISDALDTAKWLLALNQNIHIQLNDLFANSCQLGHLKVGELLTTLGTISNKSRREALKYSQSNAEHNGTQIIDWIQGLIDHESLDMGF